MMPCYLILQLFFLEIYFLLLPLRLLSEVLLTITVLIDLKEHQLIYCQSKPKKFI